MRAATYALILFRLTLHRLIGCYRIRPTGFDGIWIRARCCECGKPGSIDTTFGFLPD